MSLIVEDGTGLLTAESYVSVAAADTYHAALGLNHTTWASASTPNKEAALRKATQYIDATYSFKGQKVVWNQALSWPRYEASWLWEWQWSSPNLTRRLSGACCELALRALTEDLFTDVDDRAITQETVGPVSTSYAAPTRSGQKKYGISDRLLAPLTAGGLGTLRVERK